MSTQTPNLHLTKQDGNEGPSRTALNGNWDILDEAVWDLQESVSFVEGTYTLNGLNFRIQKFGRVAVVTSDGSPTSAIQTASYISGQISLPEELWPLHMTVIYTTTGKTNKNFQVSISNSDGAFRIGHASETISTSEIIRCNFTYMTAH